MRSGEDLLRLALVYACEDVSLRDVSAWCKESKFAHASDVAVLKRLRSCVPFLREVVSQLLEPVRGIARPLRLKLLDATSLSRKKAVGTDFRVHMGYDVQSGRISGIELTDDSVGERLDRIPVRPDEVIVGDMAYNDREALLAASAQGAHVLVRTHPKLSSFQDADGTPVDLLKWAQGIEPGEIRELRVSTRPFKKVSAIQGRVLVILASERSYKAHLERMHKKAVRNSRKPTELQVGAARYIFLFTTLEPDQADAGSLFQAYRLRWQIEMLFKRIKGILTLGELRAKDKLLCEALTLAKLILLLLIQKTESDFSPWGYPLDQSMATAQR